MRIQELEHRVGIERATIRYYEKEGLIHPARSENGYRDYSEEDAAELRRIKLMRELGVTLETIRSLQTGDADFREVMDQQAVILTSRAQQMDRARTVCQRISADGATYQSLDIPRYESLLEAPLLPGPAGQGSGGTVYTEHIEREVHPWRRFFARVLDHMLCTVLLFCFVVMVLRWRPVYNILTWVIIAASWFAAVPAEAALIHFFGTTPGKLLMGIRVESAAGGRLPYAFALERAWKAFYVGMGCRIPFVEIYCMYKGYKAHHDEVDTSWDLDCGAEVVFRPFNSINVVLALAFWLALQGVEVIAERDAVLPKFRSNDLTVAQFAKNYNDYNTTLRNGALVNMGKDGTIDGKNYTSYITTPELGTIVYNPYDQFTYEMDGNAIKSISFSHTWNERNWEMESRLDRGEPLNTLDIWIPEYCRLAMFTAISSQAGLSYTELLAFQEQFKSDQAQPIVGGYTAAYGSVTCTWDLELELHKEAVDSLDAYEVTMEWKIEFE